MKIPISTMAGALARAFLQYKDNPAHSKHLEGQYLHFHISWTGNDLKDSDLGDIFIAAQAVLDIGQSIRGSEIKAPQQNGHGLVVRVRYPYPLPWHVIGNKANREFVPKLAMSDIARCLYLARSNRDTERLLALHPDPSPFWQRLWRRYSLEAERRRIEAQNRKAGKERARTQRDFP
jgi:hypothetical protein